MEELDYPASSPSKRSAPVVTQSAKVAPRLSADARIKAARLDASGESIKGVGVALSVVGLGGTVAGVLLVRKSERSYDQQDLAGAIDGTAEVIAGYLILTVGIGIGASGLAALMVGSSRQSEARRLRGISIAPVNGGVVAGLSGTF